MRHVIVVVVMTLALCAAGVAVPSRALAHPRVIESSPADGALLQQAPRDLQLTFDEPVALTRPGVRLYFSGGQSITLSGARSSGDTITAPVPPGLAGGYVVAFVVVGDEGHPVGGATAFGVGSDPRAVAQLLARVRSTRSVDQATAIGRGLAQAAAIVALIAAGGLWLAARLGAPGGRARLATLTLPIALVGVLSNLVLLVLLASLLDVAALTTGVTTDSLQRALATAAGQATGISVVVWAAVAALAYSRLRRALWWAAAAPLALAATQAGAAHGDLTLIWRLVLVVHILAAATWCAAIWCVALATAAPADKRLQAVKQQFRQRRGIATTAVVVLVLTGGLLAVSYAGSSPREAASSQWGALILAKVAVGAAALLLAAAVKRALRRAGGEPHRSLRTCPRIELVLLLIAAALAGAAATSQSPGA